MIVTEALSRLKEKIVQRVNGCGQESFINKVLLGEQYLTCENVFAGKPKCRLYPFSLLGHHLTFFRSLVQKPFWYYSGRVFMLQTNKEFSQKSYGGTTGHYVVSRGWVDRRCFSNRLDSSQPLEARLLLTMELWLSPSWGQKPSLYSFYSWWCPEHSTHPTDVYRDAGYRHHSWLCWELELKQTGILLLSPSFINFVSLAVWFPSQSIATLELALSHRKPKQMWQVTSSHIPGSNSCDLIVGDSKHCSEASPRW